MDFKSFRSSLFFKIGQSRFFIFGHPTSSENFCMYESMTITALDSSNQNVPDYFIPTHKKITPFHLKHALGLVKNSPTDQDCLPLEFKQTIISQWIEVTDICNKIINDHNMQQTVPKEKLIMNNSKLLITEPGISIGQHIHMAKQTITMVYFFEEDKIIDGDPPNFLIGKNYQHKIYLPNSNKIIFGMKNDPPHYVFSNKWGFWWFHDFNDYCDIPTGLSFTYWNNLYLNNNNV